MLWAASVAVALATSVLGYIFYVSLRITLLDFHVFVAMGLILGLIAPALMFIFQDRRRNEIDNNLPRILEDISEGLQAGITLIESIEVAAKHEYGWISKELKTLVAQLSWGIPIEEALENFSKRIGTDMAKKTTALLLGAIRLGGDLRSVFSSTARFLRRMLDVKEDRNEQLRPYLSIIYVTLIVFLVTMLMLFSSLSTLYEIQSPMLRLAMTQGELKILLFDLAIAQALFGGLIASKLSAGTMYPGLKHSIIMLLINTVTLRFLF